MTATRALALAGYTHRSIDGTRLGEHDIFDESGKCVASLNAYEVWGWLARELERKVAA